jgi:Periplasmic binding protein
MIRQLLALHLRWAALLSVAILVPAGANSAGSQSSGSTGAPITPGASLSLTAALGSFGVDQRAGYQQAVADAKGAGGIKIGGTAHQVKLVVLNNQSDPSTAAQQVRDLVRRSVLRARRPGRADSKSLIAERFPAGLAGLDGEAQVTEDPDRARLPALKVARGQALAGGELIGRAQDGLGRVAAFVPDQVIRRGGGEAVRGEELLRTEPVVLGNGAHHVITGHRVPHHRHVRTVPGSGIRLVADHDGRRRAAAHRQVGEP